MSIRVQPSAPAFVPRLSSFASADTFTPTTVYRVGLTKSMTTAKLESFDGIVEVITVYPKSNADSRDEADVYVTKALLSRKDLGIWFSFVRAQA
jgi:hypothetical protein